MAEFKFSSQVCSAYSTREDGNMSLSYGDTSSSPENRINFLKSLRVKHQDLICAKQVHSSSVQLMKEEDLGRGALTYESAVPGTDALITDKKYVPLAIFTADCLSVFLYDSKTHAIGLAHAGWRSSKEQITSKTIQLMHSRFGTEPADLLVGLGPAIRNCCYEVEENFQDIFEGAVIKRNDHYYLDLIAANKAQLVSSGVKDTQIIDSGICTSCRNAEFYSYRKEGASCGRMISVMMRL